MENITTLSEKLRNGELTLWQYKQKVIEFIERSENHDPLRDELFAQHKPSLDSKRFKNKEYWDAIDGICDHFSRGGNGFDLLKAVAHSEGHSDFGLIYQ